MDKVNRPEGAIKRRLNLIRFPVRLELQAAFFSRCWANRSQNDHQMMESGDLEEAPLMPPCKFGDDRLQRQSTGR